MWTLLLIGALAPAHWESPVSFDDWIVACDNRRDCQAAGFVEPVEEGDLPFIGVIVTRKADGTAEPTIEFDQRLSDVTGGKIAGLIRADGRDTDFRVDQRDALVGNAREFAALLARSGAMSVVGDEDREIARIRTSGASAAFRFMDDRQMRVDNASAIVAQGGGPMRAVPKPPELPRIVGPAPSAKPPKALGTAALAEIRKKFELCETRGWREPAFYRLDAVNTLAIVNCWQGPYQSDGIIVLVSDAGTYRLAPIESVSPDETEVPVIERSRLIEPEWDEGRRLLSMHYRGRGLNDCGAHASWVWDGKTFRLAHYAALDECRGVTARLPQWQTANDPRAE
jgi:hypothetical protein